MERFFYIYLMKRVSPYELSNHLGNVLTVITDRKIPVDANNDFITDYYLPDVISSTDYYAFGAPMPGRSYNSNDYKYGYNGKEKDDEINVNGGDYDFGARIYDSRLGRFLSRDPHARKYPFMTPYCFAANNPIRFVDVDGKGPGDPPGPFRAVEFGDFYSIGYGSTSTRKYTNIGKEINYALSGVPGAVLEIIDNISEHITNNSDKARNEAIRDFTKELHHNSVDASGLEKASKYFEALGYIITAYDITSEVASDATREEALTELTMFVAQLDIYGSKIAPGGGGVNEYFYVPKDQFKDAQEITNKLNETYNNLNKVFEQFDLTNKEEFNVARDILYNTKDVFKMLNGTKFNFGNTNIGGGSVSNGSGSTGGESTGGDSGSYQNARFLD